jgi:hypothetical protein
MNAPTLLGGKWTAGHVMEILKNEKHTGNSLLQKTFVADHLSKKWRRNTGQLAMYYAEGTHPGIIDAAVFERAREITKERAAKYKIQDTSGRRYPFTGKLLCANCGKKFKRKTTRGITSWQCATFLFEGKAACPAKQVPESTLVAVTAAVLGLGKFDAEIFAKQIAEIKVPAANQLVYKFKDGRAIEKTWQDRSRRESWTEEMKQRAREKALKQNSGRRERP